MLFEHLLEPGDRVVVEQPTYDRTLLLLQRRGVELVPVPLEADGLDVGALRGGARGGADQARPRDPQLPQPRRLHALGREARAAGRARRRARLLDLRGRPLPRAALRGRGAGDDALARRAPGGSSTPPPSRRRSAPACGSATWPGRPRRSPSSRSAPTRPTSRRTCWPSRSSSSSAARAGSTATSSSSRGLCASAATRWSRRSREQIPEAEFVVPGGGYFLWLDLAEGTDTTRPARRGQGRGRRLRRRPRLHDRGRREQPPPLLRQRAARADRRGRRAHRPGARARPRRLARLSRRCRSLGDRRARSYRRVSLRIATMRADGAGEIECASGRSSSSSWADLDDPASERCWQAAPSRRSVRLIAAAGAAAGSAAARLGPSATRTSVAEALDGGRRRRELGPEGVTARRQFRGAYGLPATASTAQTIAIVDAYDDPQHRRRPKRLQRAVRPAAMQQRQPLLPEGKPERQRDRSLPAGQQRLGAGDRARRRGRSRDLPELQDPPRRGELRTSLANLAASVNTAAKLGANEISNSYGGSEFSSRGERHRLQPPGNRRHGRLGRQRLRLLRLSRRLAERDHRRRHDADARRRQHVRQRDRLERRRQRLQLRMSRLHPRWQSFLDLPAPASAARADVAADAEPEHGSRPSTTRVRYQGRAGLVPGRRDEPLLAAGRRPSTRCAGRALREKPRPPRGALSGYLGAESATVLHDVTSGSNGSCSTIMCKGAGRLSTGPTGVGTPKGIGAF